MQELCTSHLEMLWVFFKRQKLYYKVQDDYQAWAFVCATRFFQACFVWPVGSMYIFLDNF